MEITERTEKIIQDIQTLSGTDPFKIFAEMASKDYVSIHGPEHHILDGACLLTAYRNAGGVIDLDAALKTLTIQGLAMPGAMCGLWGICGAVTSIGAALAIIDGTGPLTTDGSWGEHMSFTSKAIGELGEINGPRCCKRDAAVALKNGVEYVNSHYDVTLTGQPLKCTFSEKNAQCITNNCPFF